MSAPGIPEAEVDLEALRALLRRSLGADVEVIDVRRIRPWTVARCHLDGAPGASSVIVKWLRSNATGFRVERRQILTEAAALEMVARIAAGVSPHLVAHDADRDLLVIEDLAPRRTLHSVLSRGLTPTGHAGLHTFAAAMGRLHAATSGRVEPGPWDDGASVPIGAEGAHRLLDHLSGIAPITRGLRAEVDGALAAMSEPGPFRAFSNGDSGANNCLVAGDGGDGVLIDFEHACSRHVLLDAAALHVPGSMWMTVADPVPLGVEDTYRRVAAEGVPAVLEDSLYGYGLSAACALRTLDKLARFDKLEQRPLGHHSRPQLVTTIERTVMTVERWDRLPALHAWLHDVARALRTRWPDADLDFADDYTLREPFEPDH